MSGEWAYTCFFCVFAVVETHADDDGCLLDRAKELGIGLAHAKTLASLS
jgi:hypothetical protein